MNKTRVLITGAAGFIGSRLCDYLLKNVSDILIIAVDDLSGGFIENIPIDERLIFVKADLKNKESQMLVEEQIKKDNGCLDYIYALSAYAAEGLSPFIRQFNYANNVIVNAFLINCGIKYNIKRFIFTSSMAVYGVQNPPFDEKMIPKPIDPYGIAKYACEMDIHVAYQQHGMEYVIIRPHNVYGPFQNIFDPYRNVLGIWMYKALNNEEITVYGDGLQKRAFSYIDDTLPCLFRAAIDKNAKNQIINVGGTKEISLNDAAKILCEVCELTEEKIIHLEPRHEVKNAWSTFQKSMDLLEYNDSVTLKEGLQKMWEWAKKQPKRERKHFNEYELDKGIYDYWK